MAFSRLPSPGTSYGPCPSGCSHVDCAETRRLAACLCPICRRPIGYDNSFSRDAKGQPSHLVCLLEPEPLTAEQHNAFPAGRWTGGGL